MGEEEVREKDKNRKCFCFLSRSHFRFAAINECLQRDIKRGKHISSFIIVCIHFFHAFKQIIKLIHSDERKKKSTKVIKTHRETQSLLMMKKKLAKKVREKIIIKKRKQLVKSYKSSVDMTKKMVFTIQPVSERIK